MMLRVTPEAQSEIDLAAEWYETQSTGLSSRFYAEMRRAYEVILRQPGSFPRVSPRGTRRHFRQFVLKRFSYSVIYEIDEPDLNSSTVGA
jgi:plasmid stabilization system protein ParE